MTTNILIAGGGVIGSSIAYYLAQQPQQPRTQITVIEAHTPACSASGKAGGFLALDWCDAGPLENLARKSFALHADLSEKFGPDTIGYRRVKTHSVAIAAGGGGGGGGTTAHAPPPKNKKLASLPSWVDTRDVVDCSCIGTETNTAQVNPRHLTEALLQDVLDKGGILMQNSRVVKLKLSPSGDAVRGVVVRRKKQHTSAAQDHAPINNSEEEEEEETTVWGDVVVLALGVWSTTLRNILPDAIRIKGQPFSGLKVHSMVLADNAGKATADALFCSYRGKDRSTLEPEVYPRPDKTVYVCGVSSEEEPPATASDVTPEPQALHTLKEVAASVSPTLAGADVLKEQACFLPCTGDGMPVIGKVPGIKGLYVATGHSCWGILNGPATGLAMAELITTGASTTLDLSEFTPGRYIAKKL